MPIRTATGLYHVRFTVQGAANVQHRTVQVPGTDLDTMTTGSIIRALAADQNVPDSDVRLVAIERSGTVLEWFDDDPRTPIEATAAKAAAPKANRQPEAK